MAKTAAATTPKSAEKKKKTPTKKASVASPKRNGSDSVESKPKTKRARVTKKEDADEVKKEVVEVAKKKAATPKAKTTKKEAADEVKKDVVQELKKKENTPKSKRAKIEPETAVAAVVDMAADGSDADVYITSSKACQAFKVRAEELQKLVKGAKPGCKVFINTEKKLGSKPDRGTFAVKVNGKTLVELLAMPRPFTAMKALVIKDLADKVIGEL